jgi:uncharacterized protein (DUF697 family)
MDSLTEEGVLELIDEVFGADAEFLTVKDVRKLIKAHIKRAGSGRTAAAQAHISPSYHNDVATGRQDAGGKICKAYRLRRVTMYQIVRKHNGNRSA